MWRILGITAILTIEAVLGPQAQGAPPAPPSRCGRSTDAGVDGWHGAPE